MRTQRRKPNSAWKPQTASQEERHIDCDVDVYLERERETASWDRCSEIITKSFLNQQSLLSKSHREMYAQKLMISLGPKSVEMNDFGQTMRIMQAKLPVIEIEIGSFHPVLHFSPTYLRPPHLRRREQCLNALCLFTDTVLFHRHIRKSQGLPGLQLPLLSPGKSFSHLTVGTEIGQSYQYFSMLKENSRRRAGWRGALTSPEILRVLLTYILKHEETQS